jgi:hypothetical protein
MNKEIIGTTKRRKQMMLNNEQNGKDAKKKDTNIYYYGPESKYISNRCDSKHQKVLLTRYIENNEKDEDDSNTSTAK